MIFVKRIVISRVCALLHFLLFFSFAGNFDNGLGSGNCTTVDGECNIKKSMVSSSINPVNFSVTGVILAGYSYSGSDSILLTKP